MAKFAWVNAIAAVALLSGFAASAEEPKALSIAELLSPSTGPLPGKRIAGFACTDFVVISPMGAAGDLLEAAVTEGRGEAVEFIVHLIIDRVAVPYLCDPLVAKPTTYQLDIRKSIKVDQPPVVLSPAEPSAGLKAVQELCPTDQFYNLNSHACVGLQVSRNCAPGLTYDAGQCVLDTSVVKPRCHEWEKYSIVTDACEIPNGSIQACTRPQFFSPLEQKCVSQISAHRAGVSCGSGQIEFYGTCVQAH
jgi:hypothetical protein